MIIIEANEIPEEVFRWYGNNSNGFIKKTLKEKKLVRTIIDDVEEKYLYPSQAWASISTGESANIHKIRWYNDAKEDTRFYWRDLAKKHKYVALMNVLHTGSITKREEKNYDFIFPDFFSLEPKVLKKYRNFQVFNHNMSVSSGRKTSKRKLLLNAIKSFIKRPILSNWGVSLNDFSKWKNIIFSLRKDSEVLRNAQFILQQRIFINIINEGLGMDLAVFFTNHVASCLHRNFHDLKQDTEKNLAMKNKIYQSMKMLDEFLYELKNKNKDREIILISAMGQKLNTKVNENYKLNNSKDYKLTNYIKFLDFLGIKAKQVEILYEMIPQYTFKFLDNNELKKFVKSLDNIGTDPNAMRFGYYVPTGKKSKNTQGFFYHLDKKDKQITCTMTVRPDSNGYILLNNTSYHFEDIGFTSLNVNDFHHGEHSKYGCMITLDDKIDKEEIHFTEIKKYIISKI